MAFAMRYLGGHLTRLPGSASGFEPWYTKNRETAFRSGAGFSQGGKFNVLRSVRVADAVLAGSGIGTASDQARAPPLAPKLDSGPVAERAAAAPLCRLASRPKLP